MKLMIEFTFRQSEWKKSEDYEVFVLRIVRKCWLVHAESLFAYSVHRVPLCLHYQTFKHMPIPPPTLQRSLPFSSASQQMTKTGHMNNFDQFLTRLPFILLTGGFFALFMYVLHSTLLHLPPLRFRCVGGCWDRTLHSYHLGIGCQTAFSLSATSHPLFWFSYSFSITFSVCLGIATRLRTSPPWCQLRSRPRGRLCLLIRPRSGIQLRQPAPVRIPGHRR